MLRFENIYILYAFLIIAFFIALFIFLRRNRVSKLKQFGDMNLIESLYPQASKYKPAIKLSLLLTGLAFIILGTANPQIGSKLVEIKREGVDVVVALDVSNSMKAEDIKPNRLVRAKQLVSNMIDNLMGDRIGIIVFAGEAFIQLPMTTDYSAAKLFLESIDTDIIPQQGTAIGKAIELAISKFKIEEDKKKALVIITDGEDHEGNVSDLATEAVSKGYIIYTIGMGTVQGGFIPIYNNGYRSDFLKDRDGNVVLTKLNQAMLQEVALIGKGKFIRSAEKDADLSKVLDEIAKMDKKEYESSIFSDYDDKFQYFFAIALFFLALELLFFEIKNPFITSLNLFGDKKK